LDIGNYIGIIKNVALKLFIWRFLVEIHRWLVRKWF